MYRDIAHWIWCGPCARTLGLISRRNPPQCYELRFFSESAREVAHKDGVLSLFLERIRQ